MLVSLLAVFLGQEANAFLWPLSAVVGAVGAVIGWSGHRARPVGPALAAVAAGGLVLVLAVLWVSVTVVHGFD